MATAVKMDVFTALEILELDTDERNAYSERINDYFGQRSKEDDSTDEGDDGK